MKARTKKYRLTRGTHRAGKRKFKVGDILELAPRQARAMVNKVEAVAEEAKPELFPAPPAPPAPPATVEELHSRLTELGVDFDETETEEELRDKYDFAMLPE